MENSIKRNIIGVCVFRRTNNIFMMFVRADGTVRPYIRKELRKSLEQILWETSSMVCSCNGGALYSMVQEA